MDRLVAEASGTYFWVAVVGINILIGILATYLVRFIDRASSWARVRRRYASERARARYFRAVRDLIRHGYRVNVVLHHSTQSYVFALIALSSATLLAFGASLSTSSWRIFAIGFAAAVFAAMAQALMLSSQELMRVARTRSFWVIISRDAKRPAERD